MGRFQDRPSLQRGEPRDRGQGTSRRLLRGALVAAGLALASLGVPQETEGGFNGARAFGLLIKQCDFGFRVPGTKAHDACRDYLKAKLAESCDSVAYGHFSHTWSVTGQTLPMDNVIGDINWKEATTRVVLFAHWDTRPTADQEERLDLKRQPIPGADDGASGVAVLLELARNIKDRPLSPKLGVRIVLIDGEDLGPASNEMYLGAIDYAKSPEPRGDYGILLDMIGQKGLRVPMEPNSVALAQGLTQALYEHAQKVGLAQTFPLVQGEYAIEDDHLPLIKAGLPTVDLIDFEYPDWHRTTDTPDKCSADSLQKVGDLLDSWLRQPTPWKPA